MRNVLLVLFVAVAATAQTSVPMIIPQLQYLDANGVPLTGAKLCTYIANTTTPQVTYKDAAGTANTNPIILDSAGRFSLWGGPLLYKFILLVGGDGTCATGTVQWTQDNVPVMFAVGGTSGYVQYSGAGGLLAGDANLQWKKMLQQLAIVGASPAVAAETVVNGYILAEGGFNASNLTTPTLPLSFNVIQAPYGGVFAKSLTSKNYTQVGNFAGPPPVTLNDTFQKGAISYDTVAACLAVWDGAAWNCISLSGGGTGFVKTAGGSSIHPTGGAGTVIPLDIQGDVGQTANLLRFRNFAGATLATMGPDGHFAAASIQSNGDLGVAGDLLLQAIVGANQCLQVNTSGVVSGSGGPCGVAGGGANATLSNLTSPTAINQSLLFDTDNTYTVGSVGAKIQRLFAYGWSTYGSNFVTNGSTLTVQSGGTLNVNTGSTFTVLPVAVASLPACGTDGMRRGVTDSNATLTAGIGAIVAGGGANHVPVYCDGTNWRIY